MTSSIKPRVRVAYSVLPVGALYFHCENQDIPQVRKTRAGKTQEPDFYAWIEPVTAPTVPKETPRHEPDLKENTEDTEAPVRDRKRVQYGTLAEGDRFYLHLIGGTEWIRGTAQDESDPRHVFVESEEK